MATVHCLNKRGQRLQVPGIGGVTCRLPDQVLWALLRDMQEWVRDAEAGEEVLIMEELPQALRREVSHSVNRRVFARLGVFHDFPPREQAAIAAMMTPVQARARP